MASFKYKTSTTIPGHGSATREWPSAEQAVSYARRCGGLDVPDGTTITIERRRAVPDIANPHGRWLPYRRYEVHGGVVRRVDR